MIYLKQTLKAFEQRALTKFKQDLLIKEFNLDQEELLEQVRFAGRTPAVLGGGVLTEETGLGPYPKVYGLKTLDEKNYNSTLEKYGSIASFQVEKVNLNDKAVRVSYHGLGMHAGIMDPKQGVIVAFGHGPKECTMRYTIASS